jgi:DNA-binding NtrC family response regulator
MTRVLLFEPEAAAAALCREQLEALHLWVVEAKDLASARELLQKQFFHLCVWHVQDAKATHSLFETKQKRTGTTFISTGWGADSALIVECMRAGASHYWPKESTKEVFRSIVAETLSRIVPEQPPSIEAELAFPHFIGRHPKMLEIFELIHSIKVSDSNILITGESGTGKEVVARAIHNVSPRKKQPWVAVNCGAIPANLLESELFGHVKGAFTGATQNRAGRFQLAGSGTLFLDEISDLPFDLQAKILRAIQNRVYEPVGSPHSITLDARIIAATNQDLELAVSEKRFREDLYYRLNVIPIYLPPLRSRKSDIPLLVKSFLDRFSQINRKEISGISEEAMRCLMQYHWPGNIRELENLVERVVVLKRGTGIIELKDFPIDYFRQVRLDRFVANVALPEEGLDFNEAVNEFENELILQALQRTAGNRNRAATLLNLNRTTLVEKLKRKGLRIISS